MKKILVTGGAGFLGSHLCKELLERGNHVICLDNFYTGRKDNINRLLKNDHFTLIEWDIINPLPEDFKIDEIYNLACPASPPAYQKDSVYTTKVSVLGILNLLELSKRCDAKLLHTSTSEVYGDPKVHPQSEEYRGYVNPIGIRACYDEGKRCAESLLFDYRRQYKIEVKVVRIFNIYGPNMDPMDGRVISNFIVQALNGSDITVYGNGFQTRSFCYVNDLIDRLLKMMATEKGFIGPVNLGNPQEYTVMEIANEIVSLTKSCSKIVYEHLPEDDPMRRQPNIALAKEKLNWKPKVSFELGLLKTIEYFKKLRN